MKWLILLIGFVCCLSIPSIYAEPINPVVHGKNYDNEFLGYDNDGNRIYQWTSHPQRILVDEKWQDYDFTDDIQRFYFESASTGVSINKDTCTLRLYDSGEINTAETPVISSVSMTLKQAAAGTDEWESSGLNNEDCTISREQIQDGMRFTLVKSTLNIIGVGREFKTMYDIKYTGEIKGTFSILNNELSGDQKYGFTQSMDGAFKVTVGSQTFDTATLQNEVSFDKAALEGQIITISQNGFTITYDPQDYVHDYLWAMKIKPNHINFDFTDAKQSLGIGQSLSIDPTFGYTAADLTGTVSSTTSTTICGSPYSTLAAPDLWLRGTGSAADPTCYFREYYWDLSSLSDSIVISSAGIRYDVSGVSNPRNCDWRAIANDPTMSSATQQWIDTTTGNLVRRNDSGCTTATNDKTFTMTSNGTSYLQSQLSLNWAAFGMTFRDQSRDASTRFVTVGTTELQITYSLGPMQKPTNLSCDGRPRAIACTWNAPNPGYGLSNYYRESSLNNSTWVNATTLGNVTSMTVSNLGVNNLIYIKMNSTDLASNSTNSYASATTDNVPGVPLNQRANGTGETTMIIRYSAPTSNGGDSIVGYKIDYCITCTSWTNLVNATNTLNYNQTGLPSSTTVKYRVAAWNGVGLGTYTANFTGTTYAPTTGTVTLTSGVVGDVIQINSTVAITTGVPSPITISQLKLYANNSLVETKTVSVQIATGSSSSNFDAFWYRFVDGSVYSLKVNATASNVTGTVQLGSSAITASREYDPSYSPAMENPSVQGSYNYTLERFDDEDGVHLQVNRLGGTLSDTWQIECVGQTNAEAAAQTSPDQSYTGVWKNYTVTGYFNNTWTGMDGTHLYITCFNDALLFTTTSYTNSSLALFGIEIFDASYGQMLGVPVGIFFLAMAGSMANKRTAPTWIIIVLGMAGTMAAIGFFTFSPLVWGLALVAAICGVMVNQKVF